MGFLTTITIHNDRLHEFEANPLAFAQSVFEGIRAANRNHKRVCLEGGYLEVLPSRHADDHAVYLHAGNHVEEIQIRTKDLTEKEKEYKRLEIKRAKEIITFAAKSLKK